MSGRIQKLLLAAALACGLSVPAFTQQAGPAQASASTAEMTEGEIRKIDKAAGKVTVKHGEIRSLDMPPMTMVFGVADVALLDKVKQGDKVRFRAVNRDGKFTITEIQTASQ